MIKKRFRKSQLSFHWTKKSFCWKKKSFYWTKRSFWWTKKSFYWTEKNFCWPKRSFSLIKSNNISNNYSIHPKKIRFSQLKKLQLLLIVFSHSIQSFIQPKQRKKKSKRGLMVRFIHAMDDWTTSDLFNHI